MAGVASSIKLFTVPQAGGTLTASFASAQSISLGGTSTALSASGFSATIHVTASTITAGGYTFNGWYNGASLLSSNVTYSFTITTGQNVYSASFSGGGGPTNYSVSLADSPSGNSVLSGSGVFASGSTVTAAVGPNYGYTFLQWTTGSVTASLSPTYSFSIANNTQLTASLGTAPFSVSLVASPSGDATLSGSGIFLSGSTVSVSAGPNYGYTFLNWTSASVNVSTSPTYSFAIGNTQQLTASLGNASFTASIAVTPSGSASLSGSGIYVSGSLVTITATPIFGYAFNVWTTGSVTASSSPSYTFALGENDYYTASVYPVYYTVYTVDNPLGSTVLSGSGTFLSGSTISVTATANAGFTPGSWLTGSTTASALPTYTFVLGSDTYLTASTDPIFYTINAVAIPVGNGTATGSGVYPYNGTVTLTENTNSRCIFVSWLDEGGSQLSTSQSYTFTATRNAVITASFYHIPSVSLNWAYDLTDETVFMLQRSSDGQITWPVTIFTTSTQSVDYDIAYDIELGGTILVSGCSSQ